MFTDHREPYSYISRGSLFANMSSALLTLLVTCGLTDSRVRNGIMCRYKICSMSDVWTGERNDVEDQGMEVKGKLHRYTL